MEYRTDWTLAERIFVNKSNSGREVYSAYRLQGSDKSYAAVKIINLKNKCNQETIPGLELYVMKSATEPSHPYLAELLGYWFDEQHLHLVMVCRSLFSRSHVFDILPNPAAVSCVSS